MSIKTFTIVGSYIRIFENLQTMKWRNNDYYACLFIPRGWRYTDVDRQSIVMYKVTITNKIIDWQMELTKYY